MPELPEVETVRRILEPQLEGRRVETVEIRNPQIIAYPDAEQFAELLHVLGSDDYYNLPVAGNCCEKKRTFQQTAGNNICGAACVYRYLQCQLDRYYGPEYVNGKTYACT